MPDLAIIRSILPSQGSFEEFVARSRYQRPKINQHGNQWTFRAYVPELQPDGTFTRERKRITLGRIEEMTKTQASKEADRILESINNGRFVAAAQMPFPQIVTKYKETRLKTLQSSTQGKYLSHLKNHIEPAFKGSRLADIDTPTIEAWLMGKDALSQNTKADILHVLSAIFTALRDWNWWTEENPCERVKIGAIESVREKKLLSTDEVQRFLASIPDTKICTAEAARLIAMTAAVAGARISEVLGLQWHDVDAEAQTLAIRRKARRGDVGATKSKSSRRTRQIGTLAADLAAFRPAAAKPVDWIFHRNGEPLDDRDLQQHVFRPAAEVAGIYFEGFGMHMLRALNVTWRMHEGASSIEAAKAAGHASSRVTERYTILDPSREQAHVAGILKRVRSETIN
jgi:integrase